MRLQSLVFGITLGPGARRRVRRWGRRRPGAARQAAELGYIMAIAIAAHSPVPIQQRESLMHLNVPEPIYDANPGYLELYDLAWRLAHDHIRSIDGMPQNPYMDEAFCDTRIWIWDTCFMALFCKFAPDIFPGVESFRNLLDVIHGDATLPSVLVPADEPSWTGAVPGTHAPILIQHPDTPPLFAWAELETVLMTGDLNRIRHLLHDTRILQRHYDWLEAMHEPYTGGGVPTAWRARPDGYLWCGICSGMDNTPRGRASRQETGYPTRPFLWLDALAQQALSADCIAQLATLIGDEDLAHTWRLRHQQKTQLIQSLYWVEQDGFFHDIDAETHVHLPICTPAGFWPLLAGAATQPQADRCAEKVASPDLLGGQTPWVSLARNDAMFEPAHGQYWRGAVWVPTAYAGCRGLIRYGHRDLAAQTTAAILDTMLETYRSYDPHTIWECYSPSLPEPGRDARDQRRVRPDFCGWSALLPIAGLIENVIGLHHANALTRQLHWDTPKTIRGRLGCRNYRFADITANLCIENGRCTVEADADFTLVLNGVPHPIHRRDAFTLD